MDTIALDYYRINIQYIGKGLTTIAVSNKNQEQITQQWFLMWKIAS